MAGVNPPHEHGWLRRAHNFRRRAALWHFRLRYERGVNRALQLRRQKEFELTSSQVSTQALFLCYAVIAAVPFEEREKRKVRAKKPITQSAVSLIILRGMCLQGRIDEHF